MYIYLSIYLYIYIYIYIYIYACAKCMQRRPCKQGLAFGGFTDLLHASAVLGAANGISQVPLSGKQRHGAPTFAAEAVGART